MRRTVEVGQDGQSVGKPVDAVETASIIVERECCCPAAVDARAEVPWQAGLVAGDVVTIGVKRYGRFSSDAKIKWDAMKALDRDPNAT